MRKHILLGLLLTAGMVFSKGEQPFRVMTWNVENLFDCRHDSLFDDNEFLPEGARQWTPARYRAKLNRLAKTVAAVSEDHAVDLLALCEVENETTMTDFTAHSLLRPLGYQYVMTQSRDARGIDVALLYNPHTFGLLSASSIRIRFRNRPKLTTRDVLHVAGRILSGDTLDVFVCHLPSKLRGAKTSDNLRRQVAEQIKQATDSLFRIRQTANIILLGDFNDAPKSKALRDVLQTRTPKSAPEARQLYNLAEHPLFPAGIKGTYKYQGKWEMLDQIIVSDALLDNRRAFHLALPSPQPPVGYATIVAFPFLLEKDATYAGKKPFRTYIGPRYNAGFSDHLPLFANFVCSW